MSTRSRIGMKMPDGTIKSIYCHWDGYPEGVGKVLEKYYNDPKKIEELLDLGDISSLGSHYDEEISKADWKKFDDISSPEEREAFIKKAEKCTVAYKDRDENSPIEAKIDEDEISYIGRVGRCCEEYGYLFKQDYWGVPRWHIMESPYFCSIKDYMERREK